MQNEANNILHLFRQGDALAFERLFRQYQRAVYSWILRITRIPAVAEDLTIETFWRIHQAHAQFEPLRGFEGWARRIATRVALDWLRSQRTERELSLELCAEPASPAVTDAAVTAEIRVQIAQAFTRLPPKLRVAATLAVLEELPQKDVAAALGISVTAVKLRVFRALRLLRKDLERQGITP